MAENTREDVSGDSNISKDLLLSTLANSDVAASGHAPSLNIPVELLPYLNIEIGEDLLDAEQEISSVVEPGWYSDINTNTFKNNHIPNFDNVEPITSSPIDLFQDDGEVSSQYEDYDAQFLSERRNNTRLKSSKTKKERPGTSRANIEDLLPLSSLSHVTRREVPFYQRPDGRWVPGRTNRDLRPHGSKKYQADFGTHNPAWAEKYHQETHKRKKPFKRLSWRKHQSPPLVSTSSALPAYDRVVETPTDLIKASEYITGRRAKADYFHHPNETINEAVQIILGFITGGVDRRLEVDIHRILQGKKMFLNRKLEKWAHKNGLDIITIPDTLLGRFYSYNPDSELGFKYRFVPLENRTLVVSEGYVKQPETYVTSSKEFKTAVNRIKNREIKDIDYFSILDPVAAITLDWCIQQQKENNLSDIDTDSIVTGEYQTLRNVLMSEKLLDSSGNPLRYFFDFSAVNAAMSQEGAKDQTSHYTNRALPYYNSPGRRNGRQPANLRESGLPKLVQGRGRQVSAPGPMRI